MQEVSDRDFAETLRLAVEARGLSLDRVRAHLLAYGHDVSVATLSYWQTGRSIPVRRASLQALGALEVILQVPRGSLAAKLPSQHTRRRTRTSGTREAIPQRFSPHTTRRIAAEMGLSWYEGYRTVAHDDIITVATDRSIGHHLVRELIIAERDGMDRLLVGYSSEIPGVLMTIGQTRGCTVGRTMTLLRETLAVTELLLDQPLRAGEPYLFEHCVAYDTPATVIRDWQRNVHANAHAVGINVRFDHGDPPSQVEIYIGPDQEFPAFEHRELSGQEVFLHGLDFGPGILAVRWNWADDAPELQPRPVS
ncbi:hypothetical protein KEM60_01422 [Austwickia sp. TVS 96-490-7B]|uniref:helix-turn-helix transcriptional regulator n=1 Tax=Austwickia sp. TVS 96-490-7B TaxID=2830843 RepID=UPI001C56E0CD|nr:helix-turn-helix transcriptional regulator [Austwickia sp. TVS 96-490-7B]MBW3085225.1 hypothetical protein [Austwickia sp. TVS 96-490-7B]